MMTSPTTLQAISQHLLGLRCHAISCWNKKNELYFPKTCCMLPSVSQYKSQPSRTPQNLRKKSVTKMWKLTAKETLPFPKIIEAQTAPPKSIWQRHIGFGQVLNLLCWNLLIRKFLTLFEGHTVARNTGVRWFFSDFSSVVGNYAKIFSAKFGLFVSGTKVGVVRHSLTCIAEWKFQEKYIHEEKAFQICG